jgi:hypothetical protein
MLMDFLFCTCHNYRWYCTIYIALVSCWGCVVFDPAHMRGGLYAVFTVQ